MNPEYETIPGMCAAAANRYGSATAIEDGQVILSFTELNRVRVEMARSLHAAGVRRSDRVAIWAPNGYQWVVAALAAMTLRAVLVPINTRMKGEEAAHILGASKAKLLFSAGDFLGKYYPDLVRAYRPASLQRIVVMGEAQPGDLGWNEFAGFGNAVSADEVERIRCSASSEDLSDIMFTSGTTGHPKGVMTCHGQNLRAVRDWSSCLGLRPGDRYMIVNPFFHAFGYKSGWLASLMNGVTMLPHQIYDAEHVMRRIQDDRITVLPGPPAIFLGMLAHPRLDDFDLSTLRVSATGAAAIAPSLIEQMRTKLGMEVVLTGYGLTESCGYATICDASDDAVTVATTCGKAMPGIEITCRNERGEVVLTGEAGEVWIRGYNVMQGYLDDGKATREAIDEEGWLHTGDVGSMTDRGYLRITDRLKDMFIVGGFNSYPAEIERMMQAHEAIAQVAVIGVPDERLGEVGKAFVVLKPGHASTEDEIIQWCRQHMANYKVPRSVAFIDALPTNASGKVVKNRLRSGQASR